MNLLLSVLLGIIQGFTEFLPISSSGHLAIFQNLFGEVDVPFDAFLHLATLLAVLVYFSKDIINIFRNKEWKILVYLIIATIPAALAGYFLRNIIYNLFSNLLYISLGFFITGLFLFAASYSKSHSILNYKNSFIIGLSQALALIPGISRSGATISTGILQGVERKKAIRFSFLLSIPIILGAFVLNFQDIKIISSSMIFGFIAAFFSGFITIHIFIKKINLSSFKYFAYYCWLLALILFLSQIL